MLDETNFNDYNSEIDVVNHIMEYNINNSKYRYREDYGTIIKVDITSGGYFKILK